ncbi:MAG TPA: protein-export chaperone SecB [Alphaproteobacteria bacterium]
MADEAGSGKGAGQPQRAAAGDGAQPQLAIRAQYVKDLSFENPQAPQALQRREPPRVELQVQVGGRALGEGNHEVELHLTARASHGEELAFLAELVYAGVFFLANIPPEQMRPVLMVECPRLLFPFARRVVADCTRDGGFPPLMLEPIDFAALYRRSEAQRRAGDGGATGDGAGKSADAKA